MPSSWQVIFQFFRGPLVLDKYYLCKFEKLKGVNKIKLLSNVHFTLFHIWQDFGRYFGPFDVFHKNAMKIPYQPYLLFCLKLDVFGCLLINFLSLFVYFHSTSVSCHS